LTLSYFRSAVCADNEWGGNAFPAPDQGAHVVRFEEVNQLIHLSTGEAGIASSRTDPTQTRRDFSLNPLCFQEKERARANTH
jgi:hypothetical protein